VTNWAAMTYSLPPLNALRAFEAAARHLSFKLAAHELHVTPAAVGQQVKALEARLGVSLRSRERGIRARRLADCAGRHGGSSRDLKLPRLAAPAAGRERARNASPPCVGKHQPELIEHDAGKSCVGSSCTNVAISGENRDRLYVTESVTATVLVADISELK